jgi:hypothetical protein
MNGTKLGISICKMTNDEFSGVFICNSLLAISHLDMIRGLGFVKNPDICLTSCHSGQAPFNVKEVARHPLH